jgi:hypothetical protein
MTRRLFMTLFAFALLFVVFFLGVRPWYLAWGATDEELVRPLPGDEIIPDARSQETRAITIDAPIDHVWPWVAQIGQDRGGFYSFDLLENLVGCEMPYEDRLRPEKQSWRIGDKLWMYPKEKAGGAGFATLRVYIPGRALGFGTRVPGTSLTAPEDGSWSFVLEPIDGHRTRVLVRGRGARGRSPLGTVFDRVIFEPAHFAMERRMMIGLEELTEHGRRSRTRNHLQVALWMLTFAAMTAALILTLRRRAWVLPLGTMVAAAIVFEVLTLRQPPLLLASILSAIVAMMLAASYRDRHGFVPP